MLSLLLVSFSVVDLSSWILALYHNSARISLSCIFNHNFNLPAATLIIYIALFEDRSNGKDVSKLFIRLFWCKVGRFLQVKILESTADAALCYLCQNLLCLGTWEIILPEIKVLKTLCLFADNFRQHFGCSFSFLACFFIFEPWLIYREI